MRNKKNRILCGLLALSLVSGLCACGSANDKESTANDQSSVVAESQSTPASSEVSSSVPEEEKEMYPIEGDVTLTYAIVSHSSVLAHAKDVFDTPFGKALQEATGVTIECINCTDSNALNLLIAGGDLPDLIYMEDVSAYNGGAAQAIKDGVIEPLNDYIDEYAPDLKAVLESNKAWDMSNRTVDGDIIGAPFIRGDQTLCVYGGLIIRKDWLDELNLDVPQTPDDLYEVLKAFKEKKGAEIPFTTTNFRLNQGVQDGAFASAFGHVKANWYQVDGKVHFGRMEEGYKDTLAFLNKLYMEGLLDPNYLTNEDDICRANMANGVSGVAYGNSGAYIGRILTAVEQAGEDTSFELAGFGPLVEKDGDVPLGGQCDFPIGGGRLFMTPQCKNKEAAVMFMNYAYTEAGHLLHNFGIEGVSYEMIDGYPTYTDLIKKHPEGWSMQEAIMHYSCAAIGGPYVQDARYQEQYAQSPQQQAAIEQWANTQSSDYLLPTLSFTEEDQAEYSKLIADIDTYVSEMFVKFVTGEKSIDVFESEYVEQLRKMKIDRVIEIQQAALDEFNSR